MGLILQRVIKIGILSKTIIKRTTDLLLNMQWGAKMEALMERLEISHFSKFTQNSLGSVLILQFIYSFAFPLSAYSSFSGAIVVKVKVQQIWHTMTRYSMTNERIMVAMEQLCSTPGPEVIRDSSKGQTLSDKLNKGQTFSNKLNAVHTHSRSGWSSLI